MNGLRYIRMRCNLSLSDLSERIGVTRQALSTWENGKKEIPEQRRKQLSEFLGVDETYFGDISDAQKQFLLERAMFRYTDGEKEYCLYRPKNGWDGVQNPDHERICFPDDHKIRPDEELFHMRQKKQKTLEHADDLITWTSQSDSLESRILCIRRGCLAYDMTGDLLESMRGKKSTLKMPFFYELLDVWKAMHLAYGLLEEDQIPETDREKFYCGEDRAWIIQLADQIKEHWDLEQARIKRMLEEAENDRKNRKHDSHDHLDLRQQIAEAEEENREFRKEYPELFDGAQDENR